MLTWESKTYDHSTGWYEEATFPDGRVARIEKGLQHRNVLSVDGSRVRTFAGIADARECAEKMASVAITSLPEKLKFLCLSPGVYETGDSRVTLYWIEGCYPPAWNVEWTVDFQNVICERDESYGPGCIGLTNIVDGAATKRDALALAADAWPALREKLIEMEVE